MLRLKRCCVCWRTRYRFLLFLFYGRGLVGFRWMVECLCSSNSNNDSSFCSLSMWTTYILSGSQNSPTHCLIQILFVFLCRRKSSCRTLWQQFFSLSWVDAKLSWRNASPTTLALFKLKYEWIRRLGKGRGIYLSIWKYWICCIPFTLEKFLIDMSMLYTQTLFFSPTIFCLSSC